MGPFPPEMMKVLRICCTQDVNIFVQKQYFEVKSNVLNILIILNIEHTQIRKSYGNQTPTNLASKERILFYPSQPNVMYPVNDLCYL